MTGLEFVQTVLAVHLIGGLVWFVYVMGFMPTDPKGKIVFQKFVQDGSSVRYKPNFVRLVLIVSALGTCLLKWEVSAYNTIKNSYKNSTLKH